MKSVDFPETVSAKVTSRCKKLLEKHNISVRSAVEVGLNTLLSSKGRLEFEIMELDKEIREVKLDLIALEMERDQLLGKLEGLHIIFFKWSANIMKKSVTLTIDSIIWEQAKEKLPQSRSEFVEEQLRKAIGLSDDKETELRKKIAKHQDEINVLESQLCKIREERLKNEKQDNDEYGNAMDTVYRIHERLGFVGKNQLKNISKQQQVSFDVLVGCVINEGLNLVNYAEGVK